MRHIISSRLGTKLSHDSAMWQGSVYVLMQESMDRDGPSPNRHVVDLRGNNMALSWMVRAIRTALALTTVFVVFTVKHVPPSS